LRFRELGPGSTYRSILDLARRQGKHLDWGLLFAFALGLFAAAPFLSRAGLPRQTDAELHVYRAAELGHVILEGVRYARWAPNLYLGYGYPIFNYYAPLTYYVSNAFALVLPAVGIVTGVKAVFVLGLLLASLGTYLLGRRLFGPEAGVLAAASFTFSPYVVFIDPQARGDLAEHFAICLAPLAFYFFHQLMGFPSRGRLLASVLSLGAVVFSHNLTGLVISGLMVAYWLWQVVVGGKQRHAPWGAAVFALAAALVAVFWLPAVLESDAVKLQVIGPGHFDFREHFLCLGELLAPSRLIDWGATGPRFRHNLGLAQWLLTLPALLVAAKSLRTGEEHQRGRGFSFFVIAALSLVFLMVHASKIVWESVPVMPYLQFPWRLLGPANLMLAVCVASIVTLLPEKPWRQVMVAGGFALIIATALPLLYPAPWHPHFGGTSPADIIQWERESQAFGTTSTGDFLPITVKVIPPPMDTLIESFTSEGPVDKVNRATVPERATVTVLEHKPNYDHLAVETPKKFRLRLYTFYFPGWKAYVDGTRVEIEIGEPEGFITLEVPSGTHDVLVRFEDTLPRKIGAAISAAALVSLAAICATWQNEERGAQFSVRSPRAITSWLWLGGVLILIVSLKLTVLDPSGALYYRSPPGQALAAQHRIYANFGGKIELIGYDLPDTRVRRGDTVRVALYWHAMTSVKKNYQSFVHLAEPLTVAWAQEDHLNPGGLPTSRWPRDRYVWDEYKIRIPPETPPGDYRVNVGLYLMSEGSRLQRLDGDQNEADSIVIGSISVVGRPE
jgi:hypothetical protein